MLILSSSQINSSDTTEGEPDMLGALLAVGGESAGGGLTAATTLYVRDKGEVNIAYQMPLYPMIDDRMNSELARGNNGPVWNSKSSYNACKLCLGNIFGKENIPAYAVPARVRDYRNLPATVTFVGDIEAYRDETIRYSFFSIPIIISSVYLPSRYKESLIIPSILNPAFL